MATQPTRRPWHSGTDAIWASSAAAGDTESAPTDGERIAGHVNNTGYTSGRANWLWAAVAEWLQRVRDSLLPQHADNGDHVQVVVTPSAAGQVDLSCLTHAADASTQRKIEVKDVGAVVRMQVLSNGYITGRGVALDGGSAADVTKVVAQSQAGDAAATKQLDVTGTAGTTVFAVQTDGTLVSAMPAYTITLTPAMFHPMVRPGGSTDTAVVYEVDEAAFDGTMNIADANTRYIHCPEMRLQVGDSITAVTLHADRGAGSVGTVTLQLRNKSAYNTIQTVGTATVNAGANHQTATLSGLPHSVTDIKGYYWLVSIANSTPAASEVKFQFVEITISRTRVR